MSWACDRFRVIYVNWSAFMLTLDRRSSANVDILSSKPMQLVFNRWLVRVLTILGNQLRVVVKVLRLLQILCNLIELLCILLIYHVWSLPHLVAQHQLIILLPSCLSPEYLLMLDLLILSIWAILSALLYWSSWVIESWLVRDGHGGCSGIGWSDFDVSFDLKRSSTATSAYSSSTELARVCNLSLSIRDSNVELILVIIIV